MPITADHCGHIPVPKRWHLDGTYVLDVIGNLYQIERICSQTIMALLEPS